MATEKRLIDANAFRDYWNKNYRHQYANDTFLFAIANFPTVDAVEVVRCKDCKHRKEWTNTGQFCCFHETSGMAVGVDLREDDFCSYGERRNDA